jgi:predicted anti-sigma-YlaC factor YlaD
MRCRQVRKAIDRSMPAQLDGDAQVAVLKHCQGCVECRRLLDSAAVAASLIRARASQDYEPSPFFKTRVLAAIRDRGAVTTLWSPEKMWKSTRTIVASMFALVIILLTLNLFAPKTVDENASVDTARSGFSVERIVMDDSGAAPDENITSGQVLDTVFAPGDSYGID